MHIYGQSNLGFQILAWQQKTFVEDFVDCFDNVIISTQKETSHFKHIIVV